MGGGRHRRDGLTPIPAFPRERGKEQSGRMASNTPQRLEPSPACGGGLGGGTLRRDGHAPIPAFPRERGKEQSRYIAPNAPQRLKPSPACGGGLGGGRHRRDGHAPIPAFPRERGKEQSRYIAPNAPQRLKPSPACGGGLGGGTLRRDALTPVPAIPALWRSLRAFIGPRTCGPQAALFTHRTRGKEQNCQALRHASQRSHQSSLLKGDAGSPPAPTRFASTGASCQA